MIPEMSRLKTLRSFSSQIYQAGSPKETDNTLNLTTQTARSNQFSPQHADQANHWYNSPNNSLRQTKANLLKKKQTGEFSSASQYPANSNNTQKSKTKHTQNSFSSKKKLEKMEQPLTPQKIIKNSGSKDGKNKSSTSNNASKKSINPSRASATSPETFYPHKRAGQKPSSEKSKQSSKYYVNSKFSKKSPFPKPNQSRKTLSKGHKDTTKQNKKNPQQKSKQKMSQRKKNNTFQSKSKQTPERQKSLKRQQKNKKDMEAIIEQQNILIAELQRKLQTQMDQNFKMYQQKRKLQQKLQKFSNLQTNNKDLEAMVERLNKKLTKQGSKNRTQMQINKYLQAVIVNMEKDKEKYSLQFTKECILLADRLKQRESVIEQLQASNNRLREEYAELHTNVERITEERARHLNQQLEQESFSWEQQGQHILTSSIK